MVSRKKIKKINLQKNILKENFVDLNNIEAGSIKQASKDSVRAIMLIRAFRIRGHLISNLDPLSIQEKKNIQN